MHVFFSLSFSVRLVQMEATFSTNCDDEENDDDGDDGDDGEEDDTTTTMMMMMMMMMMMLMMMCQACVNRSRVLMVTRQ